MAGPDPALVSRRPWAMRPRPTMAEVRRLAVQALVWLAIAGAAVLAGHLVSAAFEARHVTTGFQFLDNPATFDIGESVIDYSGRDSFGRAPRRRAQYGPGLLDCRTAGDDTRALRRRLPPVLQSARVGAIGRLCRTDTQRPAAPSTVRLVLGHYDRLAVPARCVSAIAGLVLSNRGLWLPRIDAGGHGLALILCAAAAMAAGWMVAHPLRAHFGIGSPLRWPCWPALSVCRSAPVCSAPTSASKPQPGTA